MEDDFAGRLLGANTFTLRRYPWFGNNTTREEWMEWQRRPPDLRGGRGVRARGLAAGDALGHRKPIGHEWIERIRQAAPGRDSRSGRRSLHHPSRSVVWPHDRAAGVRVGLAGDRDRRRGRTVVFSQPQSTRPRAPAWRDSVSGHRCHRASGDVVRPVVGQAGDRAVQLAAASPDQSARRHRRAARAIVVVHDDGRRHRIGARRAPRASASAAGRA